MGIVFAGYAQSYAQDLTARGFYYPTTAAQIDRAAPITQSENGRLTPVRPAKKQDAA